MNPSTSPQDRPGEPSASLLAFWLFKPHLAPIPGRSWPSGAGNETNNLGRKGKNK
jgi:hypothetical protein